MCQLQPCSAVEIVYSAQRLNRLGSQGELALGPGPHGVRIFIFVTDVDAMNKHHAQDRLVLPSLTRAVNVTLNFPGVGKYVDKRKLYDSSVGNFP